MKWKFCKTVVRADNDVWIRVPDNTNKKEEIKTEVAETRTFRWMRCSVTWTDGIG